MTTDRRLEILRAIVDEYVETQEPVGSKAIAEKRALGISPATIRNEMAVLEEEGFITQPHTSAGRIPTDRGYRLFVDKLSACVTARYCRFPENTNTNKSDAFLPTVACNRISLLFLELINTLPSANA